MVSVTSRTMKSPSPITADFATIDYSTSDGTMASPRPKILSVTPINKVRPQIPKLTTKFPDNFQLWAPIPSDKQSPTPPPPSQDAQVPTSQPPQPTINYALTPWIPKSCCDNGPIKPYTCILCSRHIIILTINELYTQTRRFLQPFKLALYNKTHFAEPPEVYTHGDIYEENDLTGFSVRVLEEWCLDVLESRDQEVSCVVESFWGWWGREGASEVMLGVEEVWRVWDEIEDVAERREMLEVEMEMRMWEGWERWVEEDEEVWENCSV